MLLNWREANCSTGTYRF